MKSTAISEYNVAVTNQSGRVGNVRYVQKGGKTYVRSVANRTTASSNPRSDKQMKVRLNYASLNAMYRMFGTRLAKAFEYKAANQTANNAFVQLNYGLGAYMSKNDYRNGKVILAPVAIANGSLPTIIMDKTVSSIACPGITISDTTKVSELSQAILSNNAALTEGDVITFFILSVSADGLTKTISTEQFRLSLDDESIIPAGLAISSDKLAVVAGTGACNGYACIISNEGQASKAVVSLDDAAQAAYDAARTSAAFQTARDSYGKAKSDFLNPASSDEPAEQQVTLTVTVNDTDMGSVSPATSTVAKGSSVTLTATNEIGYHFVKWSDDSTENPRTVVVDQDMTLQAEFKLGEAEGV